MGAVTLNEKTYVDYSKKNVEENNIKPKKEK